ncbi:MAG: ATP-binding protein [Myxococcota bacterium]|nr:ATP-binding protein [Myxococcota bacterium]
MRNLIAIVSVISLLALASTIVLYLQIKRASDELLVSRSVDKAGAYALAARSTPSDDGVLVLLAEHMQDAFVLHAAVYTGAGTCLGPTASCDIGAGTGFSEARCPELSSGEDLVTRPGPTVEGKVSMEVCYKLRNASTAVEPGPGPHADKDRVLRLFVDPGPSRVLPLASLLHAGMIAGLLVLLVLMTARQARTLSREQAMHRTMAEQKRLAELGRLSAVLAHEIRNPLGAIKGFAQYAREKLPSGSALQEDMQTIVVESGRLERLVRSLLSYAKPTHLNVGPNDVRGIVRRAAKMTEHAAREAGQTLAMELAEEPLVAILDPDEMTQALLNLMVNAVEAMEKPGGQVRIVAHGAPSCVRVDVYDTGAGIPQELRERLFEPFVTAKSSGTGLGLAVAARIVKAHGGYIEIEDRTEGGTRFTVCLPQHETRVTLP